MATDREPLYDRDAARCLRDREAIYHQADRERFALLLEHLGPCRRLVDIGCGWGQFLGLARESVPEVWGVDENPARTEDLAAACPEARVVICRADRLELPDGYFDAAVTCAVVQYVPGGEVLYLQHFTVRFGGAEGNNETGNRL